MDEATQMVLAFHPIFLSSYIQTASSKIFLWHEAACGPHHPLNIPKPSLYHIQNSRGRLSAKSLCNLSLSLSLFMLLYDCLFLKYVDALVIVGGLHLILDAESNTGSSADFILYCLIKYRFLKPVIWTNSSVLKKMKTSNGLKLSDSTNRKSCFWHIIPAAVLFLIIVLIGNASITTNYKERISYWRISIPMQDTQPDRCKDQCRPYGNGAVPKGIMSVTSNLERQPLWGCLKEKKPKESKSLLALAVGIKQKETVDKIVRKFPSCDFTVMLFHYDGVVVEWGDLPWSDSALHVSAMDQTKWWFAKRFLHPDIVAEYKYIFIWDEDLGVENFHPGRYLSIVEKEGLEISQPALDPTKSLVHHGITARRRGLVHRRIFKPNGGGRCYANSTEPPCTGHSNTSISTCSEASLKPEFSSSPIPPPETPLLPSRLFSSLRLQAIKIPVVGAHRCRCRHRHRHRQHFASARGDFLSLFDFVVAHKEKRVSAFSSCSCTTNEAVVK
ncbi:hypothetical protein CKAN_00898500 [Cinnamomum micranthum f. kanehirae]|uniref:Uncharacterized protein n=1 Tax=Cinnamomum micranthum f. kanehirae TaxID=337451 RepID=A0A443NPC3_9MAGN|nr:hypothetical protein CKAN_00898500 [Cinnamomum micranthum f. kanehirae]